MADCKTCGSSFEPKKTSKVGKFCSLACYYALGPTGPRKAVVKGSRTRTVKDHPLAPPSGRVPIARLVLYDKIGPGRHRCHWCNTWVAWMAGGGPGAPGNLLVDHLDWNIHNDAPENLVPSCNTCNSKRAAPGKRQKIQLGETTVKIGKHPTRAIKRYCNICGSEFPVAIADIDRGRGRYCSRECYYKSMSPSR